MQNAPLLDGDAQPICSRGHMREELGVRHQQAGCHADAKATSIFHRSLGPARCSTKPNTNPAPCSRRHRAEDNPPSKPAAQAPSKQTAQKPRIARKRPPEMSGARSKRKNARQFQITKSTAPRKPRSKSRCPKGTVASSNSTQSSDRAQISLSEGPGLLFVSFEEKIMLFQQLKDSGPYAEET